MRRGKDETPQLRNPGGSGESRKRLATGAHSWARQIGGNFEAREKKRRRRRPRVASAAAAATIKPAARLRPAPGE